jgi:hypothetical protein
MVQRFLAASCAAGLVVILSLAQYLPAAAAQPLPGSGAYPPLWQRFNDAVFDAAVYRRANVRRLLPLQFQPDSADPESTATVAQLTDYNGYHVGPDNFAGVDLFVAPAGEVQLKCRGVRDKLDMWLRGLLGLQPTTRFDKFVLLQVKRKDVFRPAPVADPTTEYPCADPQSDQYCGEFFPPDPTYPDDPDRQARERQALLEHKAWLAQGMLRRYLLIPFQPDMRGSGFPFTRLGYTYNWHPAARDRYGVSEYVVRKGSTVGVLAIFQPFANFCSGAAPAIR